MKQITFMVSDKDHEFMKQVAKENGRSMSEEIRLILKEHYNPIMEKRYAIPHRHPKLEQTGGYYEVGRVYLKPLW